MEFVRLPPVFEMDEAEVGRLHELVAVAGVLVTQPVKDEYRVPGCGSEQLVALLPADARVVRVPTTYYEGLFPWQVHAHDADGARVDAPLTDYHDLRLLQAAVDGLPVERAVDRVVGCAPEPDAVRELAAASQRELRRRNADLDVDTTDAVVAGGAEAMWTVNHPANGTLREVGTGVLATLGWSGEPAVPDHQMLGSSGRRWTPPSWPPSTSTPPPPGPAGSWPAGTSRGRRWRRPSSGSTPSTPTSPAAPWTATPTGSPRWEADPGRRGPRPGDQPFVGLSTTLVQPSSRASKCR